MNDLKLDGLTGKTIKEAEVDGFGIRMVFTDGAVFDYDASDGGYSQYELTEATADAMQKQIDHTADIGKKVSISCAHENDVISREAAIDALARMMPRSYTPDGSHPADEEIFRAQEVFADCIEALEILPSAQPEIIHCGECIYYDPPHVEKEDARYEYSEMPKEAFDVLGTGLVSMEYGINIGGRCCVDYYCKSYSDDKRVYVREDNYCGRAERRTDETD